MAVPVVKSRSLLKSTGLVASMTMLSRVLGFARDMVIAQMFGAVAGVDAFFVAFKIPNFMRRLFAEGAFSQAFVPVLSEYVERHPSDVRQFLNSISGVLLIALSLVTLLAVLFAPALIYVFAPGFVDENVRFTLTSDMLRVTFPYLLFISLTAMAGAILNTYQYFAVPAFTPVLLNVALIIAAMFGAPYFDVPVKALAWGVFVAGLVQFLLQLPFLYRLGLLPKPQFSWPTDGVKRVMKLMLPALFGVSVAQINLLLDTVFASFLRVGSVSWLYYSDRLMNFPLGVFGVAISTVILPNLSRQFADSSTDAYQQTVGWATRTVLFIALPAMLGLMVLAGPLLVSLFQYGKFTAQDVMMARLSLMAFALGLPAFMLIKVFASGFYARQDIRTPVKVGVVAMICNVVMNLIFIKPFAHMGLALATSLAGYVNAGLLIILLRRSMPLGQLLGLRFCLQMLLALSAMFAWLTYMNAPIDSWLAWHWQSRAGTLTELIGGAIVIYFATLAVSGFDFRRLRSPI